MIYLQTNLNVADNSGAINAQCIKILGKKRNPGLVGDKIIVSIKSAKPKKKVKKAEIRTAVIIRQKAYIKRANGVRLKFGNNAIVLINKQLNPIGTRIKGPVVQELRKKKYMKIVSMASSVV